MKKLMLALVMIALVYTQAFAVGTWTLVASGSQPGTDRMWRQYTATADASTGSLPALTVTGFHDFALFTVETWPGAPSPTDATDFTLSDAVTGEDLMGGTGTNGIDATTPISLIPYSTGMDVYYTPLIKGNLTLTVTNNSVNSAIINVRITGIK